MYIDPIGTGDRISQNKIVFNKFDDHRASHISLRDRDRNRRDDRSLNASSAMSARWTSIVTRFLTGRHGDSNLIIRHFPLCVCRTKVRGVAARPGGRIDELLLLLFSALPFFFPSFLDCFNRTTVCESLRISVLILRRFAKISRQSRKSPRAQKPSQVGWILAKIFISPRSQEKHYATHFEKRRNAARNNSFRTRWVEWRIFSTYAKSVYFSREMKKLGWASSLD